ncbi:hypothetical protein NQ318_003293, partial [Aromia moschata]
DKCFSVEVCAKGVLDTKLLARLHPTFCSIPWFDSPALDSTAVDRIPSILLAKRLCGQGHRVLSHVTGRNLEKRRALAVLNSLKDIGVRNVLAVQGGVYLTVSSGKIRNSLGAFSGVAEGVSKKGRHLLKADKSKDDSKCDFPYAVDFVKFIRQNFGDDFCIAVAGYPDKHPMARSMDEDINYLKEKMLDEHVIPHTFGIRSSYLATTHFIFHYWLVRPSTPGRDFVVTQASYDFEAFRRFSQLCKTAGVSAPLILGIFIFGSYGSLTAMSKFCRLSIPEEVLTVVAENKDNDAAVREFGIHHATTLIRKILRSGDGGFQGFHVFTLNDLGLVEEVLKRLGFLKPPIEYP